MYENSRIAFVWKYHYYFADEEPVLKDSDDFYFYLTERVETRFGYEFVFRSA